MYKELNPGNIRRSSTLMIKGVVIKTSRHIGLLMLSDYELIGWFIYL